MSCSRLTCSLASVSRPTLLRKGLATAPATRTQTSSDQTKVSTLSNGLTVVSAPSANAEACAVGVCIKAGSRFESYANAGASHVLKTALGSATSGQFDRVALSKSLQHLGSNASCKNDREFLFYSVQPTRERLDQVMDFFLDATTNQLFKRYELMRQFPRMELEVLTQSTETRVTDLLHRAAYRDTGLGRSVMCPSHMFKKHTAEMMTEFYQANFKMGNTALVGVGVDIDTLTDYASMIKLADGQGSAPAKPTYFGGDQRQDAATPNAVIMLANQVSGWNDLKEALAVCTLKHVLDFDTEGLGTMSPLQDAVGSGAQVAPTLHLYSDSGLFGVSINASADEAGKAVEKVAAFLRSMTISSEAVELAKQRFLCQDYNMGSDLLVYAEDLGVQAALTKSAVGVEQAPNLIKGITASDVQAVAKKLGSGKLSMAAYGNLKTVPYSDSL